MILKSTYFCHVWLAIAIIYCDSTSRWARVSCCQIDISHETIAKRVSKQTIFFFTFGLQILENEVIVDVKPLLLGLVEAKHSFLTSFRSAFALDRTISLFSLVAILCCNTLN